jgi:GNAT superfamily N-acetyltransferase
MTPATAVDADFVNQIEAHSIYSWPPQVVEDGPGGWTLRATPGLSRGRSNHALTPSYTADDEEIEAGLAAAEAFANRWQIELGLQVSPIELHGHMLRSLAARGWSVGADVFVMMASPDTILTAPGPEPLDLVVSEHADREWLSAWAACEPARVPTRPGDDIRSHRETVFASMAGRARFCHFGDLAVGIAVERDDLMGLFCLAVAPRARRHGLGQGLVKGLVRNTTATDVYIQVLSGNTAGVALYRSLDFKPAYRYCHCLAPVDAGARDGGGRD